MTQILTQFPGEKLTVCRFVIQVQSQAFNSMKSMFWAALLIGKKHIYSQVKQH